ncbi:hypothetical protein P3342_005513 [Pyrenophora teres f. teres]|nr:hypothetical protein P3342_005513 [Pyrenophora teres f. teres]
MLVNNPSPRSCESIYSSRRIHEIAQLEACEIARIPRVGDLRAAFRSSEQYKPSPDWAPAVPDWVSSRPLPSLPSLHPLPPAASHTITVEHKARIVATYLRHQTPPKKSSQPSQRFPMANLTRNTYRSLSPLGIHARVAENRAPMSYVTYD